MHRAFIRPRVPAAGANTAGEIDLAMMVLIFALLLATIATAWLGRRRLTVSLFLVTLTIAALWLLHHATSLLDLRL